MQTVWIVVNTVVASWLSHCALLNTTLNLAMDRWDAAGERIAIFAHLLCLPTLHAGIAVTVCLLLNPSTAVVATSLLALLWSLICYFMLQRFVAPYERPGFVSTIPAFYPAVSFTMFVASCFAAVMFAGWPWLALPILEWLALGFVCAELAIRQYVRNARRAGTECDRRLAIFAINGNQGRRRGRWEGAGEERYPFP